LSYHANAHQPRLGLLASACGLTLLELLIVTAIVGVLAAVAVPGLLRARMSSNEASAIGSLRAINSAESAYASGCGSNGYAQSLADLAKPPSGSASPFISPDLAIDGTVKNGYVVNVDKDPAATTITVASRTCNSAANDAVSGYFAESHPVAVGSTGQRAFATDRRATIYYDTSGATLTAALAGATALQ
jgi:type IV pilus assembly protein PilA